MNVQFIDHSDNGTCLTISPNYVDKTINFQIEPHGDPFNLIMVEIDPGEVKKLKEMIDYLLNEISE